MKIINDIAKYLTTGIPAIILSILMIIAAIDMLRRLLKPEPETIIITSETLQKLNMITPIGITKQQMIEILIKDEWYEKFGEESEEE